MDLSAVTTRRPSNTGSAYTLTLTASQSVNALLFKGIVPIKIKNLSLLKLFQTCMNFISC